MYGLDYISPGNARPMAGWIRSRLFRWHAWVAVGLWLAFSVLNLTVVLVAADRAAERPRTVIATTAATLLGPMPGAVCRDFQGCCLDFSLSLLPYCLGGLLAGLAVQLIVPPRGRLAGAARVGSWIIGLVAWFGGGIVSFAHALS